MRRAWFEITCTAFAYWLTGEEDGPDTWVTTDLPPDLKVVSVEPLAWDRPDSLRVVVESESFEPIPEGGHIPRLSPEPQMTRHRRPVEAAVA